jgi:hypothetical protein
VDVDVGKRTAISARSSTNTRTTETQVEACRRVAVQLGFDVVHEFVDENVSGAVPLGSPPGALELLAAVPVVHTTDARSPKVALVSGDYVNSERRVFRFARGPGVAF